VEALSAPAAAPPKGRLGFAEGQLFGRSTRKLLNELSQRAIRTPPEGGFPGPLGEILLGLLRMVPRLVGWEVFSWMPLRLAASWVKLFAPQSWLMVKSK